MSSENNRVKASKIIKTKKTKVLTSSVNLFYNKAFCQLYGPRVYLNNKHAKKKKQTWSISSGFALTLGH